MFVCKHELPKIWMGRIQKYWDKIVPADYPVSGSTFSTSFKSDAVANAVVKMEDEIVSENCVALTAIPENTFVSNYVGVYEVDGTPGELTLLCPKKVSSENIVAMHYDEENDTWENIEAISVIDGYVWGTLESFSPIAVFEYKMDIVIVDGPIVGPNKDCKKVVVANGNTIKVYGEGDKVFVVGPSNIPVEITEKANIVGGSIDGTPIETTNVTVIGVKNRNLVERVYAGSVLEGTKELPNTTVGTSNIKVIDSELNLVTGSVGAVRVNVSNVTVENSVVDYVASGQSMLTGLRDTNTANPDFKSNSWVKNANVNVSGSKAVLVYMGGNSGYQYTNIANCKVENSEIEYFSEGGSNGTTDINVAELISSTVKVFQTSNRGTVGSASAKIDKCNIENLYVGGESADKTVTGITGSIKFDITTGTYNILAGTNGGEIITNNNIVESIKVSRSAEVNISDELIGILGSKYIVK